MIDQERIPDADECYQFDVGGELFHVAVSGGRATLRGPSVLVASGNLDDGWWNGLA
jgi:hypothetical protein